MKNEASANRPTRRALFVTPHVPNPGGTGAERRAWNHFQALARGRRVRLALLDWGQQIDDDALARLTPRCETVERLACRPPGDGGRAPPGIALLRALARPGTADPKLAPEAETRFRALLSGGSPELLFCFRTSAAAMCLGHLGPAATRFVVDFDDIESIAMARQLQVNPRAFGLEAGLLQRLAIRRQRRLERRILERAELSLVCSESDRRTLARRLPAARIAVVPNAVPLQPAEPRAAEGMGRNLLFVGTMNFPPNADAAVFFCREVLPRLERAWSGGLALEIVGFRPPEAVRALAELAPVTVTGGVDDVAPHYRKADLVICPIRFGGGTRIKILEAMSHARPVVSTTLGAEGLEVEHGRNILIADAPEDFAEACLRLLADDDLRLSLALAGRELVAERYAAERIIDALADGLDQSATAR